MSCIANGPTGLACTVGTQTAQDGSILPFRSLTLVVVRSPALVDIYVKVSAGVGELMDYAEFME